MCRHREPELRENVNVQRGPNPKPGRGLNPDEHHAMLAFRVNLIRR